MKDVYLVSTLKSEWNRSFNPELCAALEAQGITVHLPQRDTDQQADAQDKCVCNLEAIRGAKKVLAIGMHETINWGIEVGYAHGIGKEVIVLTEAAHDIDNGQRVPVMCTTMVSQVILADGLHDVDSYLAALLAAIRR